MITEPASPPLVTAALPRLITAPILTAWIGDTLLAILSCPPKLAQAFLWLGAIPILVAATILANWNITQVTHPTFVANTMFFCRLRDPMLAAGESHHLCAVVPLIPSLAEAGVGSAAEPLHWITPSSTACF